MQYVKTNDPNIIKDTSTGFLINSNDMELQAYRERIAAAKTTDTVNERLEKLETNMTDIKTLLIAILDKK